MRLRAWRIRIASAMLGLSVSGGIAAALEERFEDLPVSVEVATDFGVDVTQALLTFPNVSPGQPTILGEHRFFNEVACRSNTGRPWYLKASLLTLKHTGTGQALPASNLQWKIVGSTGSGSSEGLMTFRPFADQPETIYQSAGDDERGREVVLQFQYSLTPESSSLAGTYVGQVVFTMTEDF